VAFVNIYVWKDHCSDTKMNMIKYWKSLICCMQPVLMKGIKVWIHLRADLNFFASSIPIYLSSDQKGVSHPPKCPMSQMQENQMDNPLILVDLHWTYGSFKWNFPNLSYTGLTVRTQNSHPAKDNTVNNLKRKKVYMLHVTNKDHAKLWTYKYMTLVLISVHRHIYI